MSVTIKSLTFATALALTTPAVAQMQSQPQMPPCGPRVSILEQLEREFSETPVSRGLASNGTIIELLVLESGTWTMLTRCPMAIPASAPRARCGSRRLGSRAPA